MNNSIKCIWEERVINPWFDSPNKTSEQIFVKQCLGHNMILVILLPKAIDEAYFGVKCKVPRVDEEEWLCARGVGLVRLCYGLKPYMFECDRVVSDIRQSQVYYKIM